MSSPAEPISDDPDWIAMAFLHRAVFDNWRSEVTSVLQYLGLYEIVTGDEQQPVGQPLALDSFKLRSRIARVVILSFMEESSLKRRVTEASDPAKIWQDLGEACDESDRLIELQRRFYSLHTFVGESDIAYISRLDLNRQPLEGTERRIHDEDLLDHYEDATLLNPEYSWNCLYAEPDLSGHASTAVNPPMWSDTSN